MVEDIEILLPDMFLLIPLNGFRGEVESVSSNQRLRWPSYLSDRPKNTNLIEDIEIVLPVNFLWIFQRLQRRSRKCLSQSEARAAILCFKIGLKWHKLGRGCWDIASCQFSLNSIQWFQRRSWKCLRKLDARAAILYFTLARKTQTW